MKTLLAIAIISIISSSSAIAQAPPNAPKPEPRQEAMRDVPFEQGSESLERVLERVIGSFSNNEHHLHITRVQSPGMPFALYVELSRRGHEIRPDRQQVWWLTQTDEGIHIRVNNFPPRNAFIFGTNSADLAVGTWAAPDMFPLIKTTGFVTLGDVLARWEGDALVLESEYPHAIAFGGAMHSDTRHSVTTDSFSWMETGTDVNDEIVWGGSPVDMGRLDATPMATELTNGVRYIDLRMGAGQVVVPGVSVAMHYESFTPTGMMLETTRIAPFSIFVGKLSGLPNEGVRSAVEGMRGPFRPVENPPFSGGVRRVFVPPAMGFPRGFPPILKANQTLVYNLMLDSVNPNPGAGQQGNNQIPNN
ncbi:MAG: hypothetical protein ACYTF7_01590 [Planctomycetota bacterium]|jgi:hypothetical protein